MFVDTMLALDPFHKTWSRLCSHGVPNRNSLIEAVSSSRPETLPTLHL
jgi:hypothetical protein